MKKYLLLLLIPLLIFLIYYFNRDTKILILNISDTENPYTEYILNYYQNKGKLEGYNNLFSKSDYRITDMIMDIENNKEVLNKDKKQTIKNALIRSDIITLTIGNTDLYYKMNCYDSQEMYEYVDNLLKDYQILFRNVRKVTKETIIVFGYTSLKNSDKKVIDYFNGRLEELCQEFKIYFVEVDSKTNKKLDTILKEKDKSL